MIVQYIAAALASARYEEIENEEPWYGEIPELRGVWATGRTEAECRARLAEALDGWLIVRFRRGLAIPPPRRDPARAGRTDEREGACLRDCARSPGPNW